MNIKTQNLKITIINMIDEFGEFIKDTSKHLNALKKDKNKLPIEDQENSWLNKILRQHNV